MKARDAAPWLSQENLLRFVVACAVLGITGAAGEGAASKATTEGFALVDTDKSGSITPGEWDSAASSGVLATVAAKIAASAAASVSSVSQFPVALLNSITMTIATELGDKTFCIAAVMAMRYPRSAVFAGAILALFTMTVLSVGIGVALPALLPKVYTHYAAAGLFAFFGYKLLKEAYEMHKGEAAAGGSGSGGNGEGKEGPSALADASKGSDEDHEKSEMEEAEEEVAKLNLALGGLGGAADKKSEPATGATAGAAVAPASEGTVAVDAEAGLPSSGSGGARARGGGLTASSSSNTLSSSSSAGASSYRAASSSSSSASPHGILSPVMGMLTSFLAVVGLQSSLQGMAWPVFSHSFSITFLAEWGDRSQIATIAMAAAQNPYGVCVGAIIGHALCTGLAVMGGRMLASKISEKTVALVGGCLFILFAIHSLIAGPEVDE